MADEVTLDSLTVRARAEIPRGLTLGFDNEHESYVWICGQCGQYKNTFKRHPTGKFYYCVSCGKVIALRAMGVDIGKYCPDPSKK